MKKIKSYILALTAAIVGGMALGACQDDFDTPAIEVPAATIEANITIADLKERFWSDETNYADSIYDPEDENHRFVIAGRVVSSDEASNVFKSLVIQDETAAIAISINSYNLYLNYRVGQEIVLDLTGMHIGKYNGLQQLGRPEWYANGNAWEVTFMSPEFFAAHAQLNGLPKRELIDTVKVANFGLLTPNPENLRRYQSQLVRLQNVRFEDAGKELFSEYHSSGVNRNLVDRAGQTLAVRTSGYSTFWNTTLPEGNLDVVGILSYYGTTGWQLILIDEAGCIKVGDRPGTKDNPYTVEQVVEDEAAGTPGDGWIKGYIVGTVAPEVETIAQASDIQWEGPFILNNTLVIGATADATALDKVLVVSLPAESPLRQYGNLRDNPGNLGKEILIKGTFEKYMGTFGITGNTGRLDEFEIDGLTIDSGEIAEGDGSESTPYNVAQVVAKNPSDTQTALESNVWVKGYIVGYMPTGGNSTLLKDAVFSAEGATNLNLVLGPTADCTDASKCIGVQLPVAIRDALNLQAHPDYLGKVLAVKGGIYKYCGGPGIKSTSAYTIEGGGTTPPTPPVGDAVTSLDATFDGGTMPAGWSNVNISGDKAWYFPSFDNNYYAAMTGFKGTTPPFDQWLLSPAIDMSKVANKVLTFESQVNGYGSTKTTFGVYVLNSADVANATKTELNCTLATAPASGYSGFVPSGNIDLSAYTGTIYIGFRYYSPQDANYATWCVDNVKLNAGAGGDTPGGDTPGEPGDAVTVMASIFQDHLTAPVTAEGYTFEVAKNGGSTAPAYHAGTSAVRIYAKGSLKITGAPMAKIVFTIADDNKYRYTTFTPSAGRLDPEQATGDTTITWVGNSGDVTFTVGDLATLGSESTKPGQIRITKIEIYPAK